ncbi:hypothetical protein ACIPUC_33390 [Streptomyces sp. LARHCF249]
MKLTRTLASACTVAAAAVLLGLGEAAADDDLVSALNNPAIGAVCFPSGQVGSGNTFNGTQNSTCAQSTDQTITNPTPPADNGATGWVTVTVNSGPIAPGQRGGTQAMCPVGKVATGGGQEFFPFMSTWDSIESDPTESGNGQTGWQVFARNTSGAPGSINARVVCIDGEAPTP